MKYFIMFLMLVATVSQAEMVDLKYWVDDGDYSWGPYRFSAIRVELDDFNPDYVGFEIHEIEIRTCGPCDTQTNIYFHLGEDKPIYEEEIYSFEVYAYHGINVFELPEPLVIEENTFWCIIDGLEGELAEHPIRVRKYYPKQYHSYTARLYEYESGNWSYMDEEFHMTISGYAYFTGLEAATWAEIKVGGGS